jgi:monoterpene epsilon-lactone hydrolase
MIAAATLEPNDMASLPDHQLRLRAAVKAPIPASVSAEARTSIAAGVQRLATLEERPTPADTAAWKAEIALMDRAREPMIDAIFRVSDAAVERREIAGVEVGVGTPRTMRHPGRALLKIHGGGFTNLGGRYVEADAARSATDGGCMAYSVDYRMPPDHPYPVPLDDCVAVYRELLKSYEPARIVVAGASAGGNLAGALALKVRDLGLPMPAGLGMLTPVTDLSGGGDTWETNYGFDYVLANRGVGGIGLYANGHDLKDPYLSPLFGDFTKGFPPTFLQSGTRDRLLSDTVRMHRALLAAGIDAELHVWEAMPHGSFGGAPEDLEVQAQFQKFVDRVAA